MNEVGADSEWLSLSDYSIEYGVSVSTLRRRIKKNQIKFKLIHGKYYLPKEPLSSQTQSQAPVPNTAQASGHKTGETKDLPSSIEVPAQDGKTSGEMLGELKKAYLDALQSKEDQILHLKQQITDLKTLVMYLERENARLNPNGN